MPLKFTDDFDWPSYTNEYSAQIEDMIKTLGRDFLIRSWSVGPDGLPVFADSLSDNWKEIYTVAYAARPASVFECGCGSMYHLKNLSVLLPQTKIYGCDLLVSQIHFGSVKFNIGMDIMRRVRILDFTAADATEDLGRYDFVFTQAVIMHLAFGKAVQFVRNMMKIANNQIMVLENPDSQDFDAVWRESGILNEFTLSVPARYQPNARLFTRNVPLAH